MYTWVSYLPSFPPAFLPTCLPASSCQAELAIISPQDAVRTFPGVWELLRVPLLTSQQLVWVGTMLQRELCLHGAVSAL